MRILIVGSGGREHALAWAFSRSGSKHDLIIAPGNAGTALLGENVSVEAADLAGLQDLAVERDLDVTVVGPEQPLAAGIVDRFEAAGLPIVGPTAAAARLEGSKSFAKAFMSRHGIPTAAHRTFAADEYDEARKYIEAEGAPIVLKASGLAAGKGAIVCETLDEARSALDRILRDREFGAAGDEVVVESFLRGEEASVFAITDGEDYLLLATAQDHKRIGEGDTGPNTGGMGAYAPAPVMTEERMQRVRDEIIEPTLSGMASEGHPYRGVLYVGLMIDGDDLNVVEFNCRLGDPEAQVILPLIDGDLADAFQLLAVRRLKEAELGRRPGAAACVVLASGGYPGSYQKGYVIEGTDETASMEDVVVFHAGTGLRDGQVVTAGGRVMGVTAWDADLPAALQRAYAAVDGIRFEEMQYRRDIGQKGLARL